MIGLLFHLAGTVGAPPTADLRPLEVPPTVAAANDRDDDRDDDSDDHSEGDDDPESQQRQRPRLRLPAPESGTTDTDSGVFWGASTGCGIGGALPAAGTALGLGLFYSAGVCGDIAGTVGSISGAVVAVPSLLMLGPCAAGGSALGASFAAVLTAQDPLTAALWTLPGLGLGVAGGALATAGLLVSSTSDSSLRTIAGPLGTTLVVLGTAAALAAGPLAVAGATITQEPWDFDDDSQSPAALRDGGVDARALAPPRHSDMVF